MTGSWPTSASWRRKHRRAMDRALIPSTSTWGQSEGNEEENGEFLYAVP